MNFLISFNSFEKELLDKKILIDLEDYDQENRNYNVETKTIVVTNVIGGREPSENEYDYIDVEPDKNQIMIADILEEIFIECYTDFPYFLFLKLKRDKQFIKFTTQRIDTELDEDGCFYTDCEVQKCSLKDVYNYIKSDWCKNKQTNKQIIDI